MLDHDHKNHFNYIHMSLLYDVELSVMGKKLILSHASAWDLCCFALMGMYIILLSKEYGYCSDVVQCVLM